MVTPHTVIEDLSTPACPALVVEDIDGFRLLIVGPLLSIPCRVWQQAYDAGVALILFGEAAISSDDFIAHRAEVGQVYGLTGDLGLVDVPSGAGYRDYLAAKKGEADADPYEGVRFVHLHTHTEYSALDGLSTIEEMAIEVMKDPDGGGAIASSDHGNCASHPELQQVADKHGLNAVFGMEAYFVPDRHRRSEEWHEVDGIKVDLDSLSPKDKRKAERKTNYQQLKGEYTHLTMWAENSVGLRNLWSMSTEAYRDGFWDGKNPRLDWDTIERHAEGIIAGTGCLRGPVTRAMADEHKAWAEAHPNHADDQFPGFSPEVLAVGRDALMRLKAIYGDRLYMEIHTNSLPMQVEINKVLAQWCADYDIEPLAAVDSHYARPKQRIPHQAWVAMSTGKTLADETSMFQGEQDYHLKTAVEVSEALWAQGLAPGFVERSMTNTVTIARGCTARVGGEVTTPTFSKASKEHPDPVQRDVERLIEVCIANWDRKVVGKRHDEATYLARFEREIALLVSKGFCGYFLIVWDYVAWAKAQGCLVGPGRGSGGGSLVAYLADIVETDPVESDLIFERFLTEGRNSLPDFDIDFPSSWRGRIIGYIKERWGNEYVANIGTISRLRTKAAINDSVRVLSPVLPYDVSFPEFEALKKAVTEADAPLAGKHLPWEEFKAQYSDMVDPMESRYREIFALVDVVMDRVKTYGKHAAGVVISTGGPLTDLPMRLAKDTATKTEVWVTQFDMNALEDLGYVKFDFLTLRTLDTLQHAIDLIREKYQIEVNPYDWKEELLDPQVWGEVSSGRTLGLFQIETPSGTRLTKRIQPANLFDLAAVMTVVRPGPMRSGLTESYLRRRAGLEAVTYLDPRLEDFLGDTFGSMIYQEQVMATCMNLAGYDSTEADVVRKLLGKKQVEKVVAAGEEFVRRAVEFGTDRGVADTLWAQMAEFAKYGFNKAHAFAYAVLGYWCVAGPTRLYVWDESRYITIAKAYKMQQRGETLPSIACYDETTGKTVEGRIREVVKTGRKQGIRLQFRSLKHLECSEDHKILTQRGYVRAGDLRPGDHVAVERPVHPGMTEPVRRALAEGRTKYWDTLDTPEKRSQHGRRSNSSHTPESRSAAAKKGWQGMTSDDRESRVRTLIDSASGGTWGARKTGVADGCGHRYASSNERAVCEWMNLHQIEHESQVWVGGGFADFRAQGVFIEFDGVGRPDSYFTGKYDEDESVVVVRSLDDLDDALNFLLEGECITAGDRVDFEEVLAISPIAEVVMYDLEMEEEPHNFLANGVVVHNCAFLRFHYPVEFLIAALSTVDADRIPEFINDCRNSGYGIVPPDVNRSKVDFTSTGMEVIYGLSMVKGIGVESAEQIIKHAPYASLDDFIERCVRFPESKVNMGHVRTLVEVGAFDSIVYNRRAAEQQLTMEAEGAFKRCQFKTDAPNPAHAFNLACGYDWANDPDPIMLPRGRGKAKTWSPKPPPRACNISCRKFKGPDPIDPALVLPYSNDEIMRKERELLGVWITHSPFDVVPKEVWDDDRLFTAQQIEAAPAGTSFMGIGLIEEVKEKRDVNGNPYAFIKMNLQDGVIEAICFSSVYGDKSDDITKDRLAVVEIQKNPRGYQLADLVSL